MLGTNRIPAANEPHPEDRVKALRNKEFWSRKRKGLWQGPPICYTALSFSATAYPLRHVPTFAGVAELVDARDSKSRGPRGCEGSIPSSGTTLARTWVRLESPALHGTSTDPRP